MRYRDEVEVAWLTRISPADRRRVVTASELDAAIDESASPRAVHLYVSERLIDDARRQWEEMKKKAPPGYSPSLIVPTTDATFAEMNGSSLA